MSINRSGLYNLVQHHPKATNESVKRMTEASENLNISSNRILPTEAIEDPERKMIKTPE